MHASLVYYFFLAAPRGLWGLSSQPGPSLVKARSPNHWTTREFPTLSLKLSQFCGLGIHCFGKDPQCSPYLLQVIINPSFSCFFFLKNIYLFIYLAVPGQLQHVGFFFFFFKFQPVG